MTHLDLLERWLTCVTRAWSSDHYQGLSESWQAGPIYCSAITGKLVSHLCSVRPEYLHALPMNEPVMVEGAPVATFRHCKERRSVIGGASLGYQRP